MTTTKSIEPALAAKLSEMPPDALTILCGTNAGVRFGLSNIL
ncbi:MAG: hypothetical protein ACTSVD_09050 [Candidatus Thorarchaeota archaeon]